MPIDPSMLATSIATLTDLDPEQDLTAPWSGPWSRPSNCSRSMAPGSCSATPTAGCAGPAPRTLAQVLEDNQETYAAGPCLHAFASGQPAVIDDATLEPRWGRSPWRWWSCRSAPPSASRCSWAGPDRHPGCLRGRPGGWDATEVSALQTYAGLVATLLGTAAKAERSGRFGHPAPGCVGGSEVVEQARIALRKLERLDDRQAFIDLRRAARSSNGQAPRLNMGALDGDVAAFLERAPGADGIGHKLSQVLLGFLATEVVPLAERLAELGIDPTPLFATTRGILRLYADTLERPDPHR